MFPFDDVIIDKKPQYGFALMYLTHHCVYNGAWGHNTLLGQFAQLSFMQYMGLWVFGLPIALKMIVSIPVLDLIIIIIIKSEVWPICIVKG